MTETDPAAKAAERIADDRVGSPTRFLRQFAVDRFAAIILAEYANETLMQARAELAAKDEEIEILRGERDDAWKELEAYRGER